MFSVVTFCLHPLFDGNRFPRFFVRMLYMHFDALAHLEVSLVVKPIGHVTHSSYRVVFFRHEWKNALPKQACASDNCHTQK